MWYPRRMIERCGTLTTFEPAISYSGPVVSFTTIRLRDGRSFVPDSWFCYAVVAEIMRVNAGNFHHDDALGGWVEGPYAN